MSDCDVGIVDEIEKMELWRGGIGRPAWVHSTAMPIAVDFGERVDAGRGERC